MNATSTSFSQRQQLRAVARLTLVAIAALVGAALGALLTTGSGASTKTVTGAPSLTGAATSPSAAADPAAYYAGRAMAGNGDFAVSEPQAVQLADQIPNGASVDPSTNTIRFTTRSVRFALVASPPGTDMAFRTAGLRDPTIEVPAGARVTVEFVNADSDMAHMWLLGAAGGGAHLAAGRPLGDPTSTGQPAELISFTAQSSGSYGYFCAFPGHAAHGMRGRLVVEPR